jgi:hypothetical protein
MKTKYLLIFALSILNGCNIGDKNKTIKYAEQKSYQEEIFSTPLQGSVFSDEDGVISLYDSILTTEPFFYMLSPNNVTKNFLLLDSVNKTEFSNEYVKGNIITYYLHNSYLKVFERIEDNTYIPLEFLILDRDIKLRNGLRVGLNRISFNAIYPKAKKYSKSSEIYINDESELTTIGCFFQNDTLFKITFYNIESPENVYNGR